MNPITSISELEKAFHIREVVFVQEQQCPIEDEFDEYDHLDAACFHILAYQEGQPAGTGRVRFNEKTAKLERICILKQFRGKGIGKDIVRALENIAHKHHASEVVLHGQEHAEGFYHSLGYKTASDLFMEDGIPHLLMTKSF